MTGKADGSVGSLKDADGDVGVPDGARRGAREITRMSVRNAPAA